MRTTLSSSLFLALVFAQVGCPAASPTDVTPDDDASMVSALSPLSDNALDSTWEWLGESSDELASPLGPPMVSSVATSVLGRGDPLRFDVSLAQGADQLARPPMGTLHDLATNIAWRLDSAGDDCSALVVETGAEGTRYKGDCSTPDIEFSGALLMRDNGDVEWSDVVAVLVASQTAISIDGALSHASLPTGKKYWDLDVEYSLEIDDAVDAAEGSYIIMARGRESRFFKSWRSYVQVLSSEGVIEGGDFIATCSDAPSQRGCAMLGSNTAVVAEIEGDRLTQRVVAVGGEVVASEYTVKEDQIGMDEPKSFPTPAGPLGR